MANREGQQLGNYRLLRLLGLGGFAEVYLGEHVYLNSQAALKVLQIVLNDEDVERFAKEARTLASLTHPHIIRVLDFAVEQGAPFLVMEYAANGSLRHHYHQGSQLPAETIVSFVRQVALALQYAHDQRLIHRDIKPENMLLGSRGEVLLSDFGLAILTPPLIDYTTQAMEPSLSLIGTTPYMAPEQLYGKPQPASDQYALGVVVYEWLCGNRPFNGSPFEIAMQHLSAPPPPLREQLPGISSSVEEVMLRVLAKDPQQRYASVQDFATALEKAYQYTLLPQSSFAPPEITEALQNVLKPGPMWKVPPTFTQFIGREKEIAEICELLKQPETRLLTLLGTGGLGKTRLSYQIAREMKPFFADGVCFVHLATVNDPDLVVPTIAQELGIQEIGAQPVLEQIKVALRSKHFLLLLDNFEQVVAVAPLVEELLAVCPRLKVVVTSRQILHLQAERVFSLPPLSLPDLKHLPEGEALIQYTAIALFVQRAQAVLPTFQLTGANAPEVAEICVRLDGLPLAIELAAARIKVLPPQALLARLSQLFQLLTGGPRTLPLRHQTLHHAIQWSYDLLDAGEQQLFRMLSVFLGGWPIEAVEAMVKSLDPMESATLAALDRVTSLLDKSLVQQVTQEQGEPRLQMLLTVREYALELLRQSGETEPCQRAHALYYLTFIEEAEPHLKGREQTTWIARLEMEQENLRAALAWLIEHGEAELALRFCGAQSWFWFLRGYWSEGRRWLDGALALARAAQTAERDEASAARAKALYGAGNLAYYQDDYSLARAMLEESVHIYRKLGMKGEYANALGALGILIYVQGDFVTAWPLLTESELICRTLGVKWELASALRKLGYVVLRQNELPRAAAYLQECLMLARALGDRFLMAMALLTLGDIAASQDDLVQAVARDQESLLLARELGNKSLIALALQDLAYLAALQGNVAQATVRAQEGLSLAHELGDKMFITAVLHTLGYLAARRGDLAQASTSYREGLAVAQEIGYGSQIGLHLIGLAEVAAAEGQPRRAARLFGVAGTVFDIEVEMNASEHANYEQVVASVRGELGEQAFTAAWAEGRAMTPEQALAAPERTHRLPTSPLPFAPTYPDGLTTREVEVLRLLAQGQTVAEIADQLVISPRTVSTHITSIYGKIGVKNRSDATRYAIEHKLI